MATERIGPFTAKENKPVEEKDLSKRYKQAEKVPGLKAFRDVSDPQVYRELYDGSGVVVPVSTPTGGIRGSDDPYGLLNSGAVFKLVDGRMLATGSNEELIKQARAGKKAEKAVLSTMKDVKPEDILGGKIETEVPAQAQESEQEEIPGAGDSRMQALIDAAEESLNISEAEQRQKTADIPVEASEPMSNKPEVWAEPLLGAGPEPMVEKTQPSRSRTLARIPQSIEPLGRETKPRLAQKPLTGYSIRSDIFGEFEGECLEVVVDDDAKLVVLTHDINARVYTPPVSSQNIFELETDESPKSIRCVYLGIAFEVPGLGLRFQILHMMG
ncbi:MAG: hypothetical protein ABIH23_17355 [bacterium]